MSDKEEKPAKPKKGKGLAVKALGALVLLGAGGGGTFAMVQTGMLGGGGESAHKEKDEPKLIRKGEEDPYAPPRVAKAKGQRRSRAKAAAPIVRSTTASARISPRTCAIPIRWSRSAWPSRPGATGGW